MRSAALVLALLCAACSRGADGGTSSAPALPPVPGVEAEVVRHRTDVPVPGQVHVRVTATGDQPFTVTAVAVDSPGFAPLPPTAVTAVLAPGRTIDLRTAFGGPDCAGPPGPAAARLTVVRPDGGVEELRVPMAGDDLAEVHRRECAVAEVRAVADIELTGLTEAGDSVTGTVVLTRAGDDDRAVTVVDAGRSVVLDLAVAGLPLQLRPGERRTTAAVTFVPASCEPHVLAETKQPFVFPLSVVVGGADPVPVPLPVEAAHQAVLQDLLGRAC